MNQKILQKKQNLAVKVPVLALLKKMLPIVAMLVAGYLSSQKNKPGQPGGLNDVLGQVIGSMGGTAGGGPGGGLGGVLGSILGGRR